MATHQAHRLPWTALGEVYASVQTENGAYRYVQTEELDKKVAHFARCLVDALQEFAVTDKRPAVDEDGNSLDPKMWGIEPYGAMGYTGYYYSLLDGYVYLNLLLLDADKFLPILQRGRDGIPYFIELLFGNHDGGHPEWIGSRLKSIIRDDGSYRLKPMTADVLQTIRDHCALLFRCLYSISGENRALDPELVRSTITPY